MNDTIFCISAGKNIEYTSVHCSVYADRGVDNNAGRLGSLQTDTDNTTANAIFVIWMSGHVYSKRKYYFGVEIGDFFMKGYDL